MAVISTLAVNLTARTAAFDKGMRKSATRVSAFSAVAKKASMRLKMFGVAMVAVATAAVGAMVRSQLKMIDATAKLSDRMGIATEKIIGLRHAAEIMGATNEMVDKSLEMFVRRLGEVKAGTGEAKRALEMMGTTANELIQMSPDKAIYKIADALNKMESTSEKAAAAYWLFGRSGTKLLNTLSLGSEGLALMQKEAEKLGITFNRDAAAKVEKFNDAMNRLGKVASGVGQDLAIGLAANVGKVAVAFAFLADIVVIPFRIIQAGVATAMVVFADFLKEVSQVAEFFGKDKMAKKLMGSAEFVFGAASGGFKKIFETPLPHQQVQAFFDELLNGIDASINATDGLAGSFAGLGTTIAKSDSWWKQLMNTAKKWGTFWESKANTIFEATRKPLETFKKTTQDLGYMLEKGFISMDTYLRGLAQAQHAFSSAGGNAATPQLAQAGAGARVIERTDLISVAGLGAGRDSMIVKVLDESLAEQKRQTELQQKIVDKEGLA